MEKIKQWCSDNSAYGKTTRTIFQGVIGVIVANIDILIGGFTIPTEYKPIIAALVMAILAPIQAQFGGESWE